MANRTRGRTTLTGALLGVAALLSGLATATPASAISVSTVITTVVPVTWADASGRQLMVTSFGATAGGQSAMEVARDTVTGQADASWGATRGIVGLAAVPIAAPVGGTRAEGVIAATDDGIISVVWSASTCSAATVCDRWFTRFDGATGAAAGSPVLVEDVQPLLRGLTDGSFVAGTEAAPVWIGADGSSQGALASTDAAVDTAGRVLTLDADGTVERRPAAGPVDLTAEVGCSPDNDRAIGPAADGGFATACMAGSPAQFKVARFTAAGLLWWSGTGTHPDLPIRNASRVVVDASDRVWVGGQGADLLQLPSLSTWSHTYLSSFTIAGPATKGFFQAGMGTGSTPWVSMTGSGIKDLRLRPGGGAVFADLRVCCRYQANTSPQMRAQGEVVPPVPSPPTCGGLTPQIVDAGATSLDLRIIPCAPGRETERPTGYRIEATWDGGEVVTTVADAGPNTLLDATVAGIDGANVVRLEIIPFNDLGDTLGYHGFGSTVLPFTSVRAFTDHQIDTLWARPVSNAGRIESAKLIEDGTATPTDALRDYLLGGEARTHVEPVARLYLTAFLRDADSGGLRYWSNRHRVGVRLATMAETFARSPEFVRRYGALSNRAYVQRLYVNLLGRPGDKAGIAFWTSKLDRRAATRGSVLAQFSQGGESGRRTNATVQPITITFLMLGRVTTAAERAAWATEPGPYDVIPLLVMATPEYAAKVDG